MSISEALVPGPTNGHQSPMVEIVVPVYNEEATLETNIFRLRRFLDTAFPFEATVTIVDNASTDGTRRIAADLTRRMAAVCTVHLDTKGRGLAVRTAWTASPAPVVAYMDVDLSTGLDALLPLVAPLLSGHSDVAIGTRLARGARVVRGPRREVISRCYNLILRTVLRNHFSDAQCGFKAIRSEAAKDLLPLVKDNSWFFDTELLVLAERRGLRIHEVPVDWTDDPDSKVDIRRTALDDLRGIWRLLRQPVSANPENVTARGAARSGPPQEAAQRLSRQPASHNGSNLPLHRHSASRTMPILKRAAPRPSSA